VEETRLAHRKIACVASGHEGKAQFNLFGLVELVFVSGMGYVPALYDVDGVATCHACWMRSGKPKATSYATALQARGEFEGELPEELAAAKNKAGASSNRSLPRAAAKSSVASLPKAAKGGGGARSGLPKAAERSFSSSLPRAAVDTTVHELPLAARHGYTSARQSTTAREVREPRPFEQRHTPQPQPDTSLGALLGDRAEELGADVRRREREARLARAAKEAAWLEDFTTNGWCVCVDDPHIDYESLSHDELSRRMNPEDHWYAGRTVYRRREVVDGKVVASGPKRRIVRKHGPIVVDGTLDPEPKRTGNQASPSTHWRRPVGCVAYHAGPDKKFSVSTVCEAIPFHLVRSPESLETGAGKSNKWVPYVAPRRDKPAKSAPASSEIWLDLTGKPWTEADYTGQSVETRTVDGKSRTGDIDHGVVPGSSTLRLVLRDGRQTGQALSIGEHTYSTGQLLQWVLCKLIESRDLYVQLVVGALAQHFPFGEGEQHPTPRARATLPEQEVQLDISSNRTATDSTHVS
jgi:hypothetical protein